VNARRENTVAKRNPGHIPEMQTAYHQVAAYADPDETTTPIVAADDYSWGVAPFNYRAQALDIPKARLSVSAGIGAVLSVAGLAGAASGLLAPEGIVIALIGVAFSLVGLASGGEDGVTGRGLAVFGLLFGIAGMVIAVVAFTHRFYWPNSDIDEVTALHNWIVAHWSWLGL